MIDTVRRFNEPRVARPEARFSEKIFWEGIKMAHWLHKNLLLSSVALSCLAVAMPVLAQEATNANGLEEIVVTANKRSEAINKVGLSITALSADTLAQRRITDLAGIATAVPSLTFALSADNTPILTLRGIGFNEASLGVYPAVSVYIDQAPLPFPVLSARSAFDLERVEVLKGPQGTLFGQNSTGGAINLIAAKPTNDFELGGDASYGRFNTVEGNAHISGPITDTLSGRLAVTGLNSGDWQYSATRPGDTNGHESYFAARALLDWDATDALKLSLNLNGSVDDSQPEAAQLIALRVQGWSAARAAAHPDLLHPIFTAGNSQIADWSVYQPDQATGATSSTPPYAFGPPSTWKSTNFTPYSNRQQFQGALRADYQFDNGMTATSLTSYDWFAQGQRSDDDGSALVFNNLTNNGQIRSFNQEVRLANDPKDPIRWVVGGNYENSNTYENQIIRYTDISNSSPDLYFINGSGTRNKQDIENFAFFGNLEYDLTDQVTLKGSARYTDSSIKDSICGYTPPGGNVYRLFNYLGGLLSTVPFAPIGPNDCFSLNQTNTPGQLIRGDLAQQNASWRGGIDYKVTPDILAYANISRGYKAGSFPTISAASYIADQPVKEESVTAYEVGAKAALFDHKVQITAAGFIDMYNGKQVRGRLFDPVFGDLETLVNIPKSRIRGVEADVTAHVTQGLTLGAAVTYLDSVILKGPAAPRNYNIIGVQTDFAGASLPFTPKWSGSANADYYFHGNGSYSPFVGATLTVVGSQQAAPGANRVNYFMNRGPGQSEAGFPTAVAPGVTCVYCIDSYATVDARVGVESNDGQWRVMAWGKNIFNEYYWNDIVTATESAARVAGRPATYGVTFSYKFQ
jgi:outer membrane receptor protein involved in Fe transport